jgi:nucleoside-diphosphate-sugar epimerase
MEFLKSKLTTKQDQILIKELDEIVSWAVNLKMDWPVRILVNGASGFLGQWVYAVLHQLATVFPGMEVTARTSRPEKLESVWASALTGEIKRFHDNNAKFDIVFDFALPPTGASSQEKVAQATSFYQNILLCASFLSKGGRLIHPSSGAVYGDLRYSENLCEDSILKPANLSIYGEAKLGIESLHPTLGCTGIDFVTPRIFSVFGPLMREDSPLIGNTFLREAAKGKDIAAQASVNVFRDFIFISDLVKQLLATGIAKTEIKNINLGSNNRLDIASFGNLVGKIAGVGFLEGSSREIADRYYGCLHHLEAIHPNLIANCLSTSCGIETTLAFYRAN